jgi:hypothetical protein
MTTYATTTDLSNALGREIDPDNQAALAALETATGMVIEFIGRDIARVDDDVEVVDGSGTRALRLRYWPVHDVAAVSEEGEALADAAFEWSADGYLRRVDGVWSNRLRSVSVTYSHGFDPIPQSVRTIVAQAAARLFDAPSTIKQESIGGYSVTYTAGAPLQATELHALERYRDR